MIDTYKFESCNKEDVKNILSGINKFNQSKVPPVADVWTPLEYMVRTGTGEEIGGVLAGVGYWNGLEIKVLWVKDAFRNKGVGSAILDHVEKLARQKGASVSMLDTFSFQAEDFYKKNGYEVIGEVKDFPPGHRRVYLSKKL